MFSSGLFGTLTETYEPSVAARVTSQKPNPALKRDAAEARRPLALR